MKVFHGTTERNIRAILRDGLLPRQESGVSTNWPAAESNPFMVYLTTAYAPYFAMCAVDEPSEYMGIIEIDTDLLDHTKLRPDEDFIYQGLRMSPEALKKLRLDRLDKKYTLAFIRRNLDRYASFWKNSAENLGNLAHRGAIPVFAITRAVCFNLRDNPMLGALGLEPTISIPNFRVCGHIYKNLTALLMGDPVDAEGFLMPTPEAVKSADDLIGQHYRATLANAQVMIAERSVELLFSALQSV